MGIITDKALKILEENFEDLLEQPASLSGKYHRSETMREHLTRCANIMEHLCDAFDIKDSDRDMLVASAWLHDIGKLILAVKGEVNKKLWRNHPTGWSRMDWMMKLHPQIGYILLEEFRIGRRTEIQRLISVHMGHWYKNPFVPKPKGLYEHLIILADYLASRKGDLFNYEENNR